MIPRETVSAILETVRIDEVIAEYVPLKKRGVNLIGLCPFHNEKTPSFTVSPSKGIYKCFGCGVGGSAVNFIMEHEHYSYPEALKHLAKKYSIDIEEEEMTPEMQQEQNERESQYVVTNFAQDYFIEQLHNTKEGQTIGLSYFKERGFTDETIEKFKLGYCPDGWDAFTKTAREEGYKLKYLEETGLTKSKGDKHYDGFRGRVIFPIHNLSGRAIGFGGRTLKKEDKIPKYVNTHDCDIYHKSKVLYGIFFSKKSIIENDNCYLVEGYTDVISMHQAGIENVVASSGTSLTQEQIRLVRRYTKNITILYDGDPAGIKASFRGIDLVLEEGMNVKVVLFPDGDDPDSYARKKEAEELNTFITSNAKDFIMFKTGLLQEDTEGDPIGNAKLIRDIVSSIALIPDHIARSLYVKECSKNLDVSERALLSELNKVRRSNVKRRRQAEPVEESPIISEDFHPKQFETTETCEYQEKDIIRLLLNYGSEKIWVDVQDENEELKQEEVKAGAYLINELLMDDIGFENPLYAKVFEEFATALSDDKELPTQHFTSHEDEELSKLAIDLISHKYELHSWAKHNIPVTTEIQKLKRAVRGAVYALKTKKIAMMIMENQKKMKETHQSGGDVAGLQKKQTKLDDIKQKLSAVPGRVILK